MADVTPLKTVGAKHGPLVLPPASKQLGTGGDGILDQFRQPFDRSLIDDGTKHGRAIARVTIDDGICDGG